MKTVTFDETKWKLVPVEATEAMVDAAIKVEEDGYGAMHQAMLADAPTPPAAEQAHPDADRVATHPSYDADCCQGHAPEPECKCAIHDARTKEGQS